MKLALEMTAAVDKFIKGVRGGVSVGVRNHVGWIVSSGVGYGIDVADGIRFFPDDGFTMGFFWWFIW